VASTEDAFEQRLDEFANGMLRTATVTSLAAAGKVVVQIDGGSMTLPRISNGVALAPGNVVLVLCIKKGAWFVIGAPATS
jgi:hypothetical protein